MCHSALALIVVAVSAVAASNILEARQAPPTCAATVCSFTGNVTLPTGLTLRNVTLSPDAGCAGCAGTTCLPLNATHLDIPLGGAFDGNISVCALRHSRWPHLIRWACCIRPARQPPPPPVLPLLENAQRASVIRCALRETLLGCIVYGIQGRLNPRIMVDPCSMQAVSSVSMLVI